LWRQLWWWRRWHRSHSVCWDGTGSLHAGNHLPLCGLRWRFRRGSPETRLHMLDHDMLPSLLVVAPAISDVVVLWTRVRLLSGRHDLENILVACTAAVLLHQRRCGLPGGGYASTASNHNTGATTDPTSNPPSYAATHATINSSQATTTAAHTASPLGVQLHGGRNLLSVGASQAAVVLHSPPPLWTGDGATATCRSLQLRRWVRKLDRRLVSWQEGVVLPRSRQRLPWSRQRLCPGGDDEPSLRLQCGLRQLGRWLECPEERLVLQKRREGLPDSTWRLCINPESKLVLPSVLRCWLSSHLLVPSHSTRVALECVALFLVQTCSPLCGFTHFSPKAIVSC